MEAADGQTKAPVALVERIGFVGAGVMGLPMARNLRKSGENVVVFDLREETRAALRQEGFSAVDSLEALCTQADIVITMLPDTPDVVSVVAADGGLAAHLEAGSLIIDMSTIAPSAEKKLGDLLQARNIGLVDAPVSGGVIGAINGTLSIMVGGSAQDFARAQPILAHMGKTILHAGPIGTGQVFKMCNQLIVAGHIQAMCEALSLARAHDGNLELLLNALNGGAAGSWMLQNLGPKILAGDDAAGFRIDLQLKDLKLAGDAAFEKGVPLPGLALSTSLYLENRAHGEGSKGNQALFRAYERLTNLSLQPI